MIARRNALASLFAASLLACPSKSESNPPAGAEPSASSSPATSAGSESPGTGAVGGDRDVHGCIGSAGFSWCEREQKCVRSWELGKGGAFAWGEDAAANQTAFENYCNSK